MGDIHGNLNALESVLTKASYNPNNDRLICLGDYVDGWSESFEVVRTLLELQNNSTHEHIYLLGNHDLWFRNVLTEPSSLLRDESYVSNKHSNWYYNGGKSTYDSYMDYPDEFIKIHKTNFFDRLKYYHIEDNKLYVHAGFNLELGFLNTVKFMPEELIWNRSLYQECLKQWKYSREKKKTVDFNIGEFDKIYIGHNPTIADGIIEPLKMGNVINLDQGCKANGCLSIWDDKTNDYFQSDY